MTKKINILISNEIYILLKYIVIVFKWFFLFWYVVCW